MAIHDDTAMIHAIEVSPNHKRQGVGQRMLRHAAHWAASHKAKTLCLAVTAANDPANQLYQKMGFAPVSQYHYRIKSVT